MWKKIRKALRRKHLCFRFQLVNFGYARQSYTSPGGQVIEVLHELQNKYDFEITNVYLSQFHTSRITIKCDKSDGMDIFTDFAYKCRMEIRECCMNRWI